VEGDASVRAAMWRLARSGVGDIAEMDFNAIIPLVEQGIHVRREKWGTKWNAYRNDERIREGVVNDTLCFQTAWSPPLPIMVELSRLFPSLRLGMQFADECGMFVGYANALGGVCGPSVMVDWDSATAYAIRSRVCFSVDEDELSPDPEPEVLIEAEAGVVASGVSSNESPEVESSNDSLMCVACMESPRNCNIDCPHFCVCFTCATKLTRCPICRAAITQRKLLIFS